MMNKSGWNVVSGVWMVDDWKTCGMMGGLLIGSTGRSLDVMRHAIGVAVLTRVE